MPTISQKVLPGGLDKGCSRGWCLISDGVLLGGKANKHKGSSRSLINVKLGSAYPDLDGNIFLAVARSHIHTLRIALHRKNHFPQIRTYINN